MSKIQRVMYSWFVRLTLASVCQLWTKKNLSWWWQKTRRMKGAKKTPPDRVRRVCAVRTQAAAEQHQQQQFSSRRVFRSLSLFSPRYHTLKFLHWLVLALAARVGYLVCLTRKIFHMSQLNINSWTVQTQKLKSSVVCAESRRCGLYLRLVRRRANCVSNSFWRNILRHIEK